MELYDSQGINPEELKKEAEENKYNVKIEIPPNFYALISEKQEKHREKEEKTIKEKISLKDMPETKPLYYESYDILEFEGIVLKVIGRNVVLNETAFYPTSGGQIHDKGFLANHKVVDVFKQGNVIVHVLDKKPSFKKGQKIKGRIDGERRIQLAQHHTATHIVNGAAKRHLGNHIWQAGASKTIEKSRLDITHYENLSDKDINEIERIANEVVKNNIPIYKTTMKKTLAESKYGFGIYQGGAVPGKELRIVEIPDFDVEACGGTHLNTTGEVISIKIIKTSKIQDGVVRIEFLAGQAAENYFNQETKQINELMDLLKCDKKQIPARCEELFKKWKLARKNKLDKFELKSKDKYEGDIMNQSAHILRTQPEHVVKTVKRFLEDIKKYTKQ
jgi:alanyl-tRNA synthetase